MVGWLNGKMVGLIPKRDYRTLTSQPFNHLAIVSLFHPQCFNGI